MSWFEYKGLYLGLLGATHSIYGWILLYKDKHPLYLISWFCALVALSITIEIFVYATYKNMEEKNHKSFLRKGVNNSVLLLNCFILYVY